MTALPRHVTDHRALEATEQGGSPFSMSVDRLPPVLPIFPLPGALLLPRQQLPLNIFEPRYLNLVFDALGRGRLLGMIQTDPTATGDDPPKVYGTGCAGRVTAFNETEDGRLLINLTGVCRFGIREELGLERGYRRVAPDWAPFVGDLDEPAELELDMDRFESAMKGYFEAKQLEVKWDALKRLPSQQMVDFFCTSLPLNVDEKQLLLEAPNAGERADLLSSIVQFAARASGNGGAGGPTRH